MERSKNSRQIPSTRKICADKKFYDILYAYLQCISTREDEKSARTFEKKEINFTKLAKIFNLSRQTVSAKFKNLKELGLIREVDDQHYEIITLDNEIALLIPYPVLKLITDTLSENSVSVYVYLFNRYYANNDNSYQFTLEQIKKHIGICTTTRSNDEIITNILFVLQKLGLIKYSLRALKQENDNFDNIKTIYQLDWLTKDLDDIKNC